MTAQYRDDLRERWLAEPEEVSRQEHYHGFLGKIVELQVADWLTQRGWRIAALEALGTPPDITVTAPSGEPWSLEIKYLGLDAGMFRDELAALQGIDSGGAVSTYGALNYLLFRAYEAAVALRAHPERRGVIVAIAERAWWQFATPLRNRWIDWRGPAFFRADERWDKFLARQRRRYPNVEADIAGVVSALDGLWVLRAGEDYEYALQFEYTADGRSHLV